MYKTTMAEGNQIITGHNMTGVDRLPLKDAHNRTTNQRHRHDAMLKMISGETLQFLCLPGHEKVQPPVGSP